MFPILKVNFNKRHSPACTSKDTSLPSTSSSFLHPRHISITVQSFPHKAAELSHVLRTPVAKSADGVRANATRRKGRDSGYF